MSSSSAGQWMPIPGPIKSQRRLSRCVPSERRGYQLIGTETVRPSRNSTIRVSAVILTFFAVTVSVARLEVLMPCLYEFCFVLLRQGRDCVQFRGRIRGCIPVELDLARTWLSFGRVPREREWVRHDRSRRRKTGTDHSAGLSNSQHDFARFGSTRQVSTDPANFLLSGPRGTAGSHRGPLPVQFCARVLDNSSCHPSR
jgi:hypothetical protein